MTKYHSDFFERGLSVRDLSYRWGVDKQTVRRLIERGELKALKLAGKVVVLAEDWKTFENKCKSQDYISDQAEETGASNTMTKPTGAEKFRQEQRMRKALS